MSPDGAKIVSVGRNGQMSTYGLGDLWPGHMQQYKRFDTPLRSVRYAPDNLHAVVAGDAKVAYFGLLGAGGDATLAEGQTVAAAAFSPDGQNVVYAATQRDTNQIALSAIESTGTTLEFAAHDGQITEVAFTPDGGLVLSSGIDGKIIGWHANSGAQSFEIDVGSPVNDVAVGPDNRLLTADAEGRVRLWDYSTQQESVAFEAAHTLPVHCVSLSRDGSRAVSGGGDRRIFVWDVASGNKIAELQGHERSVNAVAISRYGEYVLSGSDDGTVRYWSVDKQSEVEMLVGHVGPVLGVDISPFDKYGISVGTDGVARVWRLEELGR
jgi:WD40 repeat protein